jgi:hypothetical protein
VQFHDASQLPVSGCNKFAPVIPEGKRGTKILIAHVILVAEKFVLTQGPFQ